MTRFRFILFVSLVSKMGSAWAAPILDIPTETMNSANIDFLGIRQRSAFLPQSIDDFREKAGATGRGSQPAPGSADFHRLLGVQSYDGDRIIFQQVRHDTLYELTPRVGYAWNYDSNIKETQESRMADWYQTVEAGLNFKMGKLNGHPEELTSVIALETDYDLWKDWFVNHPQFDALNEKGRVDVRIGRSDLIFRPYFDGGHTSGMTPIASERVGRITTTLLNPGLILEEKITPILTHRADYSWSQLDQADNLYVGWQSIKAYEELSHSFISNEGRTQDPRYTSLTEGYFWGQLQNSSANDRTASIHSWLGGLGARGEISSHLTYQAKFGWENIERGWDQVVGQNLSTPYYNIYVRYDYDVHQFYEFYLARQYTLDPQNDDDNYTDTFIAFSPNFKFDPGWLFNPALSIGTTDTEQNRKTFYLVPSAELAYIFPNKSKVGMKIEYDESRTVRGAGGDTVSVRSTLAVTVNF